MNADQIEPERYEVVLRVLPDPRLPGTEGKGRLKRFLKWALRRWGFLCESVRRVQTDGGQLEDKDRG